MEYDMREMVRNVFYEHLNCMVEEVRQKDYLTRDEIEIEFLKRKQDRERKKKRTNIPLIGKLILSYQLSNLKYKDSDLMYETMLKLVDGYNITNLDNKVMEEICNNREEIYNKIFREHYENMYKVKELSSNVL